MPRHKASKTLKAVIIGPVLIRHKPMLASFYYGNAPFSYIFMP